MADHASRDISFTTMAFRSSAGALSSGRVPLHYISPSRVKSNIGAEMTRSFVVDVVLACKNFLSSSSRKQEKQKRYIQWEFFLAFLSFFEVFFGVFWT